mmetsp:Transcript_19572/g.39241  ORF Transcript_19572/g.39241 Transcript_19572/m.39241 type:complete len:90 (+) Transcript_19572:90-359(+)
MSSVPDHQSPNPCSLILAIAVTISLYPIIDIIVNHPLLENFFRHNPNKRQTTHRDLLLLYLGIIASSCGFFPLWFYFYGDSGEDSILRS